jgi:hypothetical protein
MLDHEIVALEALKILMGMRRSQVQITADDIRHDCHAAHAYAEQFMKLIPAKVPQPKGF